jgi:HEAT repeat protein
MFEFVDPWFSKLAMSPYLARETRQGLRMLEADLEAGLDDPQPQSVRNNLEILGGMKKLEQTARIRQLASSPDLETKAAAVLALQRVGDYSHLEQCLVIMRLSGVPPAIIEMRRLMASTFENIDDRNAVQTLLRFADSPDSTVRASAMKALRKLNDPRSVPTIVKRLDAPDFFIRYDAVFTLATIEGRQDPEWAPALGEYRAHESKYVGQWKKWWTDEGSAKYQ